MALSFDREVPRNAGTKLNEGTEMKKSSERRGVAWHQFWEMKLKEENTKDEARN